MFCSNRKEQPLPTTVKINHESNHIIFEQIDMFVNCNFKYATFGEAFTDTAILENLNSLVPGKRFLDIGCGMGDWCYTAALLDAKTVDGYDNREIMVKRAKKATAELDNVRIQVGNLDNIPYSDASFDVVTSLFVTCGLSVQTFEKHFQELYRVLAPGGKAILLTKTDWCQSRLYTSFGADPTTVENKIAEILSSLPKNPTTTQVREAFKGDIDIYVATFAVDATGNAFHVKNINQLTDCQPIWTYSDGEVFPNYFHSNRSVITNILSAGLHIDSAANHFTREMRIAYNRKGPSIPMIEKCVEEPLALVYHVSKPTSGEPPY